MKDYTETGQKTPKKENPAFAGFNSNTAVFGIGKQPFLLFARVFISKNAPISDTNSKIIFLNQFNTPTANANS
jgi:hypothetical protein